MMKHIGAIIFISTLFLTQATAQAGQKYTSSFIVAWGPDTIAVETFTLFNNHLFGKAVHGFPENHVRNYSFVYREDGAVKSIDCAYLDPRNTSLPIETQTGYLPYRFSTDVQDGVATWEILNKGQAEITRIPVATEHFHFNGDWIPLMGQFEYLVTLLLQSGRTKMEDLEFINPFFGAHQLKLERIDDREVFFWSNISEGIKIYLGPDYRIDSLNMIGSVWNMKAYRITPQNIEHYAAEFAHRPMIGNPSPHEKFTRLIDGATITVDYGRPSMRGRKVFGHIVPYGEVWRTGAGGATRITFDRDISFAGTIIPAGTYHLYTIPASDSWRLIFNTKENAWGSVYLPEYDLVRLPMNVKTTTEMTEQFTIRIEAKANTARLIMEWENTRVDIPFVVSSK